MVPSILCNRVALLHAIHVAQVDTLTTARGYVVSQRMVKEQITPQDFSEREKGAAMSREDIKFFETLESGVIHLEGQHYEMPLPFKHQNIQLPNNYAQAEKRLTDQKSV